MESAFTNHVKNDSSEIREGHYVMEGLLIPHSSGRHEERFPYIPTFISTSPHSLLISEAGETD